MSEEMTVLLEIRDLLRVIAEPQMAEQDKKLRALLIEVVGKGSKRRKAALLMDGSRDRKKIIAESEIDAGDLSKLIKELAASKLLNDRVVNTALVMPIRNNFFDNIVE